MIINHDKYYNPTFQLEQDPNYIHIYSYGPAFMIPLQV